VAYGVVLSFALWMWGRWARHEWPLGRKLIVRGLAAALAIAAGLWMLRPPPAPPDWAVKFRPYDPAEVRAARDRGRVVIVKFTASWCLECKLVDANVYRDRQVAEALRRLDALAFEADVTDAGTPATDALDRLRASPPLTVLHLPAASQPRFFTGNFDKAELLQALPPPGTGPGPAPATAAPGDER
jgi:thiol:disulfide interchange protein